MDTLTFIDQTKGAAIKEAVRSGIPASITMAQAILESGSGGSRLAQEANNYFGIKCHADWYGEHVYANDDAPNECFRKYSTPLDSFEDHTAFLKKYPNYRKLFSLPVDDYKGWATGLKAAGYATAPNYAQGLINLIERFNLHDLDKKVKIRRMISILIVPAILFLALLVMLIIWYKKKKQLKLA